MDDLWRCAENASGYSKEFIKTKTRKREAVYAKMFIANYCRFNKGMRLHQIAKEIGRDHSSVVHYVNNIKDLVFVKDKLLKEIETSFVNNLREINPRYITTFY